MRTESQFTRELKALMQANLETLPEARAALAAYGSGNLATIHAAEMKFANAYAAKAERDFRRFLWTMFALQVAFAAAVFLPRILSR